MSKSKKLSLSVISQFLQIFVSGVVGLLVVPIIIGMIGKEQFGILQLILSLMLINFFFELGMGSTVLRFIPVYKKESYLSLNSFLWTYISFKTVLGILAAFVVIIIGFYFGNIFNVSSDNIPIAKNAVYIFAVGILLANYSGFSSNILKGLERFDLALIPAMSSQIIYLLLLYLIRYSNHQVTIIHIAVIMFLIRPLIQILIALIMIKKVDSNIQYLPMKPQKKYLRESFSYLKGMSIISIFAQLYNRMPKMLLGMFLNPTSVAYWAIAERLKSPIQQISSSLMRPLIPMTSAMNYNDYNSIHKIIIKITKFHSLLIGGITAIILVFINIFIDLWLGKEFNSVVNLVRIWFIPLTIPNAGAFVMLHYAEGKTKLNMITSVINTFIGLILGIVLMHYYGEIGLAIGLTVSAAIISVILFYKLCKEFKINMIYYIKKHI